MSLQYLYAVLHDHNKTAPHHHHDNHDIPKARNMSVMQDLLQKMVQAVLEASLQICGGSFSHSELSELASDSVILTNKTWSIIEGKPHDLEVRWAHNLFYKRKRKRQAIEESLSATSITLISDYGLRRSVSTPFEVGELLCQVLILDWDVRVNPAGILCIVTQERAQALRANGKLPCPFCIKWCKGEKGLWWHQQTEHGTTHSEATEKAASERIVLALVPYQSEQHSAVASNNVRTLRETELTSNDDVCELARRGDLNRIQKLAQEGLNVAGRWDRKGASPLHWAAGYGHLMLVRYLILECHCDVNEGQRGKRSFSGRTALHWAARNGHLHVVTFLVLDCSATVDASTIDGTTAFCWACWQGHLEVMKFLRGQGCDIHKTNSFGCNAVLWCAQGEGNVLDAIKWLNDIGCDFSLVNSNGHGPLHKAAQRGRSDLVDWLVDHRPEIRFNWIGPDADGCCPSDLAGMEGHIQLAKKLAKEEEYQARRLYEANDTSLIKWLSDSPSDKGNFASYCWEAWGGTKRIKKALNSNMVDDKIDRT
jgi:ankyrin repeat protein